MKDYLLEDLNQLRLTMTSIGPELTVSFANATTMVADCLKSGGKLIVCGNGGSAADVEHLAGEIVGRFGFDRPSLPCISLCTPSATFTAIANDYGYENVFKRQVQGFAQPGDVLIGISTSGNSANVVAAFEQAREMGIKTIAMTGSREIHGIMVHSLCRAVEEILFPEKVPACLPPGKIISAAELDQFALALKAWRSVFTNGCFDVLHPGHVYVLSEARKLGDLLIVGLNSDASIGRMKGPQRPYHRFADRAAVLAALNFVDYVIEFDEDTPARLIEALTPKVLVKGGDYSIETIVGAPHVMKNGGEVKVIPLLEGHSTTGILNNNAQ